MKSSYLTAGIRFEQLVRLLKRNRVTYTPKTLIRLAFLFQSSIWSSLFAVVEKGRYAKKLSAHPYPEDPVFIIGHWRTGSTYLHQLMALDRQFVTPTLFQVAVPDSFLVSHPYFKPIFSHAVSEHRPMDMVRIGMDEPQEDEYAFYRLTGYSPLEKLVFPDSGGYFLNGSCRFLPEGEDLHRWRSEVKQYYRKISFHGDGRLLSKNPFNSFRITELAQLFPRAKFIHIIRHPYEVVPSTIHMWKILLNQNAMNDRQQNPEVRDVTNLFRHLVETIRKEQASLPAGTIVDVRFEELEANPVETIHRLYEQLDMQVTGHFLKQVEKFIDNNRGYLKNRFTVSVEERELIMGLMGPVVENYGYHS